MSDHDLPDRVRLIGGEMPTWSDLASAWEPARRGAHLPVVRAALAGRSRVLVAGPHEPELIEALADAIDGELTCLVRSIPDARAIGADPALNRVRVVCGSLERYDLDTYDAVVALDDVVRLYSTEGPEPAFDTALADLRRLLTPDGVLIMMVHNELGVHRLTAEAQPEADHSEPAWSRPPDTDDTRPRSLADLAGPAALGNLADLGDPGDRGVLGGRFGSGAAIWPVYPVPSAPVIAWGAAAGSVDRAEYAGLLAALADLAARALEETRPSADAVSLMRRVWRSGQLPEFAAGWLVITAPTPAPDVVAWLGAGQGEPVAVRVAGGRPVLPDGSAAPQGRLLSEVLAQAVVAPDQAALRSAIRGYAAWLATLSDAGPATADRVVLGPGGDHQLLELGDREPAARTADEQLLSAVTDLVRQVMRHGYRRTWPSYLTPAEAVAWVAAMRGTPVPDDVIRRAVPEAGWEKPDVPDAGWAQFAESNASRARWLETRLRAAETQLATAWSEVDKARRAYRAVARADEARLRNRLKRAAPPGALRIGRAAKRLTRRLRG